MKVPMPGLIAGLWLAMIALPGFSQVAWADLTGLAISAGAPCKVLTTSWGNSGGFSVNYIASGGNGYVEYRMDSGAEKAFGLSLADADQHYTSIDHAFLFTGGNAEIWEGGAKVSVPGTYGNGDLFRIERTGTDIKYYINGGPVLTTSATSGDLHLDFAIGDSSECMGGFTVSMEEIYFPHCKLLQQPDAGYYRTFDFELHIEYIEEYSLQADKDLYYNIYDATHSAVASVSEAGTANPAGSPVVPVEYGSNYLTLDVGSLGLSVGEVYLLEVINRKQEKRYLKFVCEADIPN